MMGIFRRDTRHGTPPAEVVVGLGGFGGQSVEPANLDAWTEETGPR